MARVLVVDDERDVVTLIRFILEKDGHRVSAAYNGAEALTALGATAPGAAAERPDLIILDVMMPVMDGYTFAARLKENPDTRDIPLLVLTAKGRMREVFNLSTNVVDTLEKPFDPKQLRELIAAMLSGGPESRGRPA